MVAHRVIHPVILVIHPEAHCTVCLFSGAPSQAERSSHWKHTQQKQGEKTWHQHEFLGPSTIASSLVCNSIRFHRERS